MLHLADPLRPPTFPYRTRYADLPSGRVAYFDEGDGEAMIFIHGLAGDFTHFEFVAPSFAREHRVIGIDMPGCGGSHKPTRRNTIRAYAETVLQLMTHLRIERATLVGHSAGGQVCAQAASIAPWRAEHLVLINTAGLRGYAAPLHWLANKIFKPELLNALLAPTSSKILDHVFHRENTYTEQFRSFALNRPKQPLIGELAKVMHDLMPDLMQPTVAHSAQRLMMPVLLIWGDRDQLVPLPGVQSVAASFPNGSLEVIQQCGHMPIIECPETTIGLIRAAVGQRRSGRIAA